MEFQEADKNVRDLITEYQDKQDASTCIPSYGIYPNLFLLIMYCIIHVTHPPT